MSLVGLTLRKFTYPVVSYLWFRAVLTTSDETGHTKRNRFVVIYIPKTSVKTEWGEFEVTTKCVNFLTQAKHMRCADNMNQKSTIVLVNERIHDRAPAVCPYSIRIFQVHVTVVRAMNTLEFYSFGVKITYSTINVYTRRSHILWIHSLNFPSRPECYATELLPSFIKFFLRRVRHHTLGVRQMCGILSRKSSNDYERSAFHHIRHEYSRCTSRLVCGLNTLGFYCVTITYSSLEYCRIFWLSRSVIYKATEKIRSPCALICTAVLWIRINDKLACSQAITSDVSQSYD